MMLVNQFERACVERCPLTTRHTAIRSGDSCRNECRTHSQTELRRDCSPGAEAETRRSRADEFTISGSRAEQSLTRGAERRLRYRLSRQIHQRRGIPSDAQKWTTRGTAESTTMPTTRWPTELWDHLSPRTVPGGRGVFLRVGLGSPRPRAARERTCGDEHVGQHVDSQVLDITKASHCTGCVSSALASGDAGE